MPENPLISVTLSYQQWNALLDSITKGTLPKLVGSREAFQSIQMQILRIRYPHKEVKHYADCHWVKQVVFKEAKKQTNPAKPVAKQCEICGWRGDVSAGKQKCPTCGNKLVKVT